MAGVTVSTDVDTEPAAPRTVDGEREDGSRRRWLPSWPPSLPQALILVIALCVVSGVVGWRLAQDDHPGQGSVDVGFLEDMQTHHLQALELGYAYLEHGSNPTMRHIAREIISFQGVETGQMRSVLASWGHPSSPDPGGTAMEWMHDPRPAQQMPGMASAEDIERLRSADGPEADELFSRLMVQHHDGGVHMADYAAANAETENIRAFARGDAASQRSEIGELNALRVQLGFEPVAVQFSSRR
jgi:uncharacterized protein (DUF305 family)